MEMSGNFSKNLMFSPTIRRVDKTSLEGKRLHLVKSLGQKAEPIFFWLNQKEVVTENYSEIIKKYILYRKNCLLFNFITGATAFITW